MKCLRNYIAEDFETIFVFFRISFLNIGDFAGSEHFNKFCEVLLQFSYILAEHILF